MPKILVADDSITVRKVAERLLMEAGMEVALAASGEEALAWLANERPDFVISDVIMPDKTGYDVCNYVRSHSQLAETPVLLISGIVNEEVTRKAEMCRADGVLKKPFQGDSLQDRVLEILARRGGQSASIVAEQAAPTMEEPPVPGSDFLQASGPPPAPSAPSAPRVFRITEGQLQVFREAATRIKELEALLVGERTRADHLAEQLGRRTSELETTLADHQQRTIELETQVKRLEAVEAHNRELPASLADLRDNTPASQVGMPIGSDDRVLELLADQQQRLAELTGHIMKSEDADVKIKALQDALANEQKRADAMTEHCAEMERAAAEAAGQLEHMSKLFAQIARLASNPVQE